MSVEDLGVMLVSGSAGGGAEDEVPSSRAQRESAPSLEEADEDDIEEMSFRERLTQAQALQAAAMLDAGAGALPLAAKKLQGALRFLRDVDEDSPQEARRLREAVLAASHRVFEESTALAAPCCTELQEHDPTAAQVAHALCRSHTANGSAVAVSPGLIERLKASLADGASARDFVDARGLPSLLDLCSRTGTPSTAIHALHAVQALSSHCTMIPAICAATCRDEQDAGGCLWWLRPTLRTDADERQCLVGLHILRLLSDTTGLDEISQTGVQRALRHAVTCHGAAALDGPLAMPRVGEDTPDASNILTQLQQLLALGADSRGPGWDHDAAMVREVCLCVRNLMRDAQLRSRAEPIVPLLLRICVLAARSTISSSVTPSTAAASATTAQGGLGALAPLEALINCMSNSPDNRLALLNASFPLSCHFSSARWGFGLKTLQPPLILTKVTVGSEAEAQGLLPGDVVVQVGQHEVHGASLQQLQQALREGGAAKVQVQRTGVGVLAACLAASCNTAEREAAASALGCLSSFFEPGQQALVRMGAVPALLACLTDSAPHALARAAADAVTNSALAPSNRAALLEHDTILRALWLVGSTDTELRCCGAKVLSLLLRGKVLDAGADPGVDAFLAQGGEAILQRCLRLEGARQVEIGGLWVADKDGAREYIEEILRDLAVRRELFL